MALECPLCKEKIDVSEIEPGMQSVCPKCGEEIVVPKRFNQKRKTSGMAIASFISSILGLGFLAPIIVMGYSNYNIEISLLKSIIVIGFIFAFDGLVLGLAAMRQIKKDEKEKRGNSLAAVAAILGVYFTVVSINFLYVLHNRPYNASAYSAGRNARLSQEVWYNEPHFPHYTDQLSDFLSFDRNLTDDTEVTFIFGECNSTGYTFTTKHKKGSQTYLFTE